MVSYRRVIFPYEAPTSHFAIDLPLAAPGRWLEHGCNRYARMVTEKGLQTRVGGCETAVRRVVSYRARIGSGMGSLTVRYQICGGSNSFPSIAIPLFGWVQ